MLHAPLCHTVAKLDISRLIDSSPSPQPPPPPVAPDSREEAHGTRSASDPPPSRVFIPDSQRSSVSSTRSGSDSYAALSASSLPPQLHANRARASPFQSHAPHQQSLHHHRPRIPSLSALPLPTPTFIHPDAHGASANPLHGPPFNDNSGYTFAQAAKRPAPGEHASAPPAKRQSKWTAEEDALVIELRGAGMKWEDISKRIPGRTPLSCRLHYQNYIERRSQWDEDRKNRLARLYERLKPEMWKPLAAELNVPWRAAEAMHWQLGQVEMARRAGVTPFSISSSSSGSTGGSRLEAASLTDASPTNAYPPASPYIGGSYTSSVFAHSARSSYLDEREQAYRMPSVGRPRSISASSGDERRSSSVGLPSAAWGPMTTSTNQLRQNPDAWPLPRLPEIEDSPSSTGNDGHDIPGHFHRPGPT